MGEVVFGMARLEQVLLLGEAAVDANSSHVASLLVGWSGVLVWAAAHSLT
jgi:hypothetical protein